MLKRMYGNVCHIKKDRKFLGQTQWSFKLVLILATEKRSSINLFYIIILISGSPVRLRVLKNGEHDLNRAVTVVGPDLGNVCLYSVK